MRRWLFSLALCACTLTEEPDGTMGTSGTTGSSRTAGVRGATGPTDEPGATGPAGSADDRTAILAKLATVPFDKSEAVPIFSAITSGAALTFHGNNYPTLDLPQSGKIYSSVPVPSDAVMNSDA